MNQPGDNEKSGSTLQPQMADYGNVLPAPSRSRGRTMTDCGWIK
jgi:hypothetical protein